MGLPRIATYDLPRDDELPAARAPWRLEPKRAALLIHDMQNYFVGAFAADTAPIVPVVENIQALGRACRARGIPVFYTAQNGNQDRRDRGLQADLWGAGMTSAPEHQHIDARLTPEEGDFVLVKHRYSAFQHSNLAYLMRVRSRDQLLICGVYAHIGCTLTAADAFQQDIEPFLVADCLADFSREKHDMALAYAAGTFAVPIALSRVLQEIGEHKQ
jgi:bifunctional isochorismate lyase/aryl carrier protein